MRVFSSSVVPLAACFQISKAPQAAGYSWSRGAFCYAYNFVNLGYPLLFWYGPCGGPLPGRRPARRAASRSRNSIWPLILRSSSEDHLSRTSYVFDVSQTEGESLPTICNLPGLGVKWLAVPPVISFRCTFPRKLFFPRVCAAWGRGFRQDSRW